MFNCLITCMNIPTRSRAIDDQGALSLTIFSNLVQCTNSRHFKSFKGLAAINLPAGDMDILEKWVLKRYGEYGRPALGNMLKYH